MENFHEDYQFQYNKDDLYKYQFFSQKVNGFTKAPHLYQLFSYILFFLFIIAYFLCINPILSILLQIIYTILYLCSLVALIYNTLKCAIIDPSDETILIYKNSIKNKNLFNFRIFDYYCQFCQSYVKESSKHCQRCERCVSGFDHHCKWINNCIGDKNKNYFFQMIISCFIVVLIQISSGVICIVFYYTDEYRDQFYFEFSHSVGKDIRIQIIFIWISNIFGFLAGIFLFQLITLHIKLRNENLTTYEYIMMLREKKQQQEENAAQIKKIDKCSNLKNKIPLSKIVPINAEAREEIQDESEEKRDQIQKNIMFNLWEVGPNIMQSDLDQLPSIKQQKSTIKLNSRHISQTSIKDMPTILNNEEQAKSEVQIQNNLNLGDHEGDTNQSFDTPESPNIQVVSNQQKQNIFSNSLQQLSLSFAMNNMDLEQISQPGIQRFSENKEKVLLKQNMSYDFRNYSNGRKNQQKKSNKTRQFSEQNDELKANHFKIQADMIKKDFNNKILPPLKRINQKQHFNSLQLQEIKLERKNQNIRPSLFKTNVNFFKKDPNDSNEYRKEESFYIDYQINNSKIVKKENEQILQNKFNNYSQNENEEIK